MPTCASRRRLRDECGHTACVADSKLKLTDVSEMEYVQANGKGQLKFTRHGIPLELDNHGVKRCRYRPWLQR